MAEIHGHSPYTTPDSYEVSPAYPTMDSAAFAAPGLEEENGWVDPPGLGYATPHRATVTEYADVPFDRRPDAAQHPDVFWQPITDVPERHAVEDQDTDGFDIHLEGSGKRLGPSGESIRTPAAELRPTTRMSPHSYVFTRPFDQHAERQFNGFHFSMADHRRDFDITGYAPVRTARNTYRIEPTPHDVDIVDVPPDIESAPAARVVQIEIPQALDRSHRLM
jgi:hypothetical protein